MRHHTSNTRPAQNGIRRSVLVSVLTALLLSGCIIFTAAEDDAQAELDKHRTLWEAVNITDYAMASQRVCFCVSQLLIPVRLTIRGGVIVAIVDLESGLPMEGVPLEFYLTVDGLFDFVQEAINLDAPRVDVRYNSEFGYPTDIDLDLSRRRSDDDVRFQISEFATLN